MSPGNKAALIALMIVIEELLTGGLLWQLVMGGLLALGALEEE